MPDQLGALAAIARAEGAPLRHVKPHGALYNQAETDGALAAAIVAGIRAFDPGLRFVGRGGSGWGGAARPAAIRLRPKPLPTGDIGRMARWRHGPRPARC